MELREDIKLILEKGDIPKAIEMLTTQLEDINHTKWLNEMKRVYDSLGYVERVETIKHIEVVDGTVSNEVVDIQYKLQEGKPTFLEWLIEKEIVTEEVKDDTGLVIKPAVSKFKREYVPSQIDMGKIYDIVRPYRLKRLGKIFKDKVDGLTKIGIQKTWMDDDVAERQRVIYELLRENAEENMYDESENEIIISKNKQAKIFTAKVVKLINDVRAKLEDMIYEDIPNIDSYLDKAEQIHLSTSELSEDGKIESIRNEFGLN